MKINEKTLKRFWDKVDKRGKNSCWIWTGAKYTKGYGAFLINKKNYSSHRIMYEIIYGNFDKKLFVCHSCDNPSCVNPYHLFLGTNSENMKDAYNKGRINPMPPIEKRFKKGYVPWNSLKNSKGGDS